MKINITIHYASSLLYSTNLPTGGNPQPISGERKVQLIMFTYLYRSQPGMIGGSVFNEVGQVVGIHGRG